MPRVRTDIVRLRVLSEVELSARFDNDDDDDRERFKSSTLDTTPQELYFEKGKMYLHQYKKD